MDTTLKDHVQLVLADRSNVTKVTTKSDSMQPATELAVDLFDNWFGPIETEVRAWARQFIEVLIRGELDSALARPRYKRSKMAGNETPSQATGMAAGRAR